MHVEGGRRRGKLLADTYGFPDLSNPVKCKQARSAAASTLQRQRNVTQRNATELSYKCRRIQAWIEFATSDLES